MHSFSWKGASGWNELLVGQTLCDIRNWYFPVRLPKFDNTGQSCRAQGSVTSVCQVSLESVDEGGTGFRAKAPKNDGSINHRPVNKGKMRSVSVIYNWLSLKLQLKCVHFCWLCFFFCTFESCHFGRCKEKHKHRLWKKGLQTKPKNIWYTSRLSEHSVSASSHCSPLKVRLKSKITKCESRSPRGQIFYCVRCNVCTMSLFAMQCMYILFSIKAKTAHHISTRFLHK